MSYSQLHLSDSAASVSTNGGVTTKGFLSGILYGIAQIIVWNSQWLQTSNLSGSSSDCKVT